PPSEVAVHPSEKNDVHEFYLMCDDVEALVAELQEREIACDPIHNLGWGLITQVALPGGGKLGIYQPRHARPPAMGVAKKAAKRPPKRVGEPGQHRAPDRRAGKKPRPGGSGTGRRALRPVNRADGPFRRIYSVVARVPRGRVAT